MRKPEGVTPDDCAKRLDQISREIGCALSEEKKKAAVRIMAENRPIMSRQDKPQHGA